MKITYDRSVDAAYVYLGEAIGPGAVERACSCDPLEVKGQINLDFDSAGHLLGIEILGASRLLREKVLENAEVIG